MPLVALLLSIVMPFASLSGAQAGSIYRCPDDRGGVLYADVPCRGGMALDLAAGRADPAAIDRLAREVQAFERRQLERDAAAREAARLREAREAMQARVPDTPTAEVQPPYWGAYAWWPGAVARPPRVRPPPPPRKPPPFRPAFVPAR